MFLAAGAQVCVCEARAAIGRGARVCVCAPARPLAIPTARRHRAAACAHQTTDTHYHRTFRSILLLHSINLILLIFSFF